jgi:hypothetical protein
MPEISQKTIEYFFDKYGVKSEAQKTKILLEATDIIYDYNNLVVKYEKEADAYRQKQILTELAETENKIKEIFDDVLAAQK